MEYKSKTVIEVNFLDGTAIGPCPVLTLDIKDDEHSALYSRRFSYVENHSVSAIYKLPAMFSPLF